VGELSAAVEKRVTERLGTVITRALDRMQEPTESATFRGHDRGRDAPTRQVHRIADLIEGQTVTVVEPGATVRMAAQRMVERNISMVAVVEKGTLAGVFSERDIMSRVVARGLDPNHTSVAAVMTTELVVVEPDDNLDTARQKMHAIGSRYLPVVREGKLIGMISIRDLLEVNDADAALSKATLLTELVTYSPDYET
jgi:CBS domain-containing protein